MMGSVRLSHLFVHVGDLQATRAFYVDLLGLELLADEGQYIRVGGSDGFAMGMEATPPEQVGAPGIEVGIRMADGDASYSRLREAGVAFDSGPQDTDWGQARVVA